MKVNKIPTCVNTTVVWQYRNSDDTAWKSMDENYSSLHESQKKEGVHVFEYDVQYCHGTKNYHYIVDLDAKTQLNEKTGKVRAIRQLETKEYVA
jgi:hypothetical protein